MHLYLLDPYKKEKSFETITMNDVVYVMVNSKLAENKEGGRRSLQEFEFDDISSEDEWIMENIEGREDNENINLNDTCNSNRDDEHLVEGQVQGGVEDDDVLAIPTLEEENVLVDVLNEGDITNEDPFNFHFNFNDLY